MAQVVNNKCKDLNSNPSTTIQKKRREMVVGSIDFILIRITFSLLLTYNKIVLYKVKTT
jgi:hypothetical protein